MSTANLSDHEKELLSRLTRDWQSQSVLRTRRQAIGKLVKLGLVEQKLSDVKFGTTHNKLYRLAT